MIEHDKEVYDIQFSAGVHTFASAGADGSIRHFDMRNLEHSAILLENKDQTPFTRIAWNRKSSNMLATFAMNSNKVSIIDIRYPNTIALELSHHNGNINAISWSPNSK